MDFDFITEAQNAKLLHNGHEDNCDQDHAPVVKLFFPGTRCVWLLSERLPHEPDTVFGLCDLGQGFPELGYASLQELAEINIADMTVQRDDSFTPAYPMSVYAEAARNMQEITDDLFALQEAKASLQEKKRNEHKSNPG